MTLPLLGSTAVVAHSLTANPSHPAVCVLPDDTVLIAWQNMTTGLVTVRHYTRDLGTVTDEATLSGTLDATIWARGMALLPDGDGATLAVDDRLFTVTTGPLSITQTGTYSEIYWARGASTVLTLPSGATVRAANDEVIVHSGGTLTRHTAPSVVTSIYPGDGTSVYLGITADEWVAVYRMDTATGAYSLAENGPAHSFFYHGPGRPGVYPTMPSGGPLVLLDTAGGVLSDTGWPPTGTWWDQAQYVGSTPRPDGGWVSAWFTTDFAGSAHIGAAVDTDTALTVTELEHPSALGLDGVAWSQSPVVASNGRTAVVVLTARQVLTHTGLPGHTYGVTAWSVEVGSEALLHVAHQDGTWRKVGDESWALGPGRMLLGVPRSQSPSGWVMEVKPGDDTTNARTMYLEMPGGADRTAPVRMVPWPG